MKELRLTKGQVALVSDEDYEYVSQFKWHAEHNRKADTFRAVRDVSTMRGKQSLASFILRVPKGVIVDHINGNTLDDQRANLRVATLAQNGRNKRKTRSHTSSQYKGVSWRAHRGKWRAYITYNHRTIYLGHHDNEIVAAQVYDKAALYYHGEFAKLNFPLQ